MGFKRTPLWIALLSVWGYSGFAMATCSSYAMVEGGADANVLQCTEVFAPVTDINGGSVMLADGKRGPITAAGDDKYTNQVYGAAQPTPSIYVTAFLRAEPAGGGTQDAKMTLSGNQSIVGVSPLPAGQSVIYGIDVETRDGTPYNATIILDGANVVLNDASLLTNSDGVRISSAFTDSQQSSASVVLSNSSVLSVDAVEYGVFIAGQHASLTSSGEGNELHIGESVMPKDGIHLEDGGTINFSGTVNINAAQSGINVSGQGSVTLDGTDKNNSSINVNGGGASSYVDDITYNANAGVPVVGNLSNLTLNLSGAEEGFNVNLQNGSLNFQSVALESDMVDSAGITVGAANPGVASNFTGTGLSVNMSGKGTGGIDVEPDASLGTLTLNGTGGTNIITTTGDADNAPTYTDLAYPNAAGVRLLGGSINLSSTDIETRGIGAPGIYLSSGLIVTGSDVTVETYGDGADGIVYTPGASGTIAAQFSPTMTVVTAGQNSYGFVVDGEDCPEGEASCTQHPFSLTFSSIGLSPANISVQGAGSIALGARNDATLVLDHQDLGSLATRPSDTYAVGAESGGKVQFTAGTNTNGASLLAGSGGTLDFNDNTSSASGSLVTISQGSGSAMPGTLDLSSRTQLFHVGGLASTGQGDIAGEVLLGGSTLELDGVTGGTAPVFSGEIQGSGSLVKAGSGEQILASQGAFDYTGATQITGGTLAVTGGIAGKDTNGFKLFQTSGLGILDIGNNGGSFDLGAISGNGTVQLTDSIAGVSSNLVLHGTGTSETFSGSITGAGGVILRSNGTAIFSGEQVFGFSGDVTLGTGTLAVTGNAAAPNNTFDFDDGANLGGTLDVSGNGNGFSVAGIQATAAAIAARVLLGSSGNPADLDLAGSGTYSFGGTISGYGNVVKQGTGTQIMSGTQPFSFNGMTVIDQGVVQLQNIADPSQLGATFELNGGWLDLSDSTFDPSGQSANNWGGLHITDGSNAAQGGIIGGNDKVTFGQDGADQVESAQIGNGTLGRGIFVEKTGSNTVTLTGNNDYVGNTRILGGTLKVSSDANLGDTTIEREVVLDGGALEIADGSFQSLRQLELLSAGTVQVDGTSTTPATLGSIAGSGESFTKSGTGGLAFSEGGSVGQALVNGGSLDLGSTQVDSTTLSSAAQPAIVQASGTTVSLEGGAITSEGDAVVADGSSTLNLSDNTQISTGGATYRVTGGTGTLNASAEALLGNILEADGAGSELAIHLSNGSRYTGTPVLTGGAVATLSTDGSSSWDMTGDTTLAGLTNLGVITFGAQDVSGVAVAHAEGESSYQALTVNGDYQGGGVINMRTVLNVGGALADQETDRMLVTGNVSGQTTLGLTTSGTGANTNTALNNQAIPTEGISLVQVGGTSTPNAFTLQGGYVVASGSPYQYRLFAYGPGSNSAPDPSQDLLPNGQPVQWDYRLQTAYTDQSGGVHPGTPPSSQGTPTNEHPTIVPQGSSYLTAPLALQNYDAAVMDSLYRRLGDVRLGITDTSTQAADVFARTIDTRSVYHTSLGFENYGYNFGQDITAVQFGGNWLHHASDDRDFRLGTAVTLGHTSVDPQAAAAESSAASFDAYNLALTGTLTKSLKSGDSWYVDGVLSAGRYLGTVSAVGTNKGSISASGLDASVEAGYSFTRRGIEIEPHVQLLSQLLHFDGHTDADGINVNTSTAFAFTGLLGVQFSMPVPWTVSWRPYVRIDLSHTWMNSPNVTMSGQGFEVAAPGSAFQIGIGATGMLTHNLSLYGELSGKQRLGPGFDAVAATLGLRYAF